MINKIFVVNSIIAFGITLGWSLILYPYIQHIKASYRRLLVWSVIITILVLIGKEIVSRFVPQFGVIFAYFLGIFLASILITMLFGYRKKSFKQLSIRMGDLDKPQSGHRNPRIRLRHIVLMGILIEEEVRQLYLHFAETSQDVEVIQLFRHLAKDEEEHKDFFEKIHQRWLPVPLEKPVEKHLVGKLFERKIQLPPIHDNMTTEDVFKYANALEQLTIEFYELFTDYFHSGWKRKQIRRIIKEERSHIDDLKSYEKRWLIK